MVAGANGQCFDRPGLHACFASAIGDGLRDDRKRRRLLLPRLVDRVLKQDGSPVLDEHGNVAVPETPRVRSDLRQDISPEQIELVRKGLWKVVNEDGGTGGRARLKDWVVAGKTGTAQATERGQEENVAWFACFAPFDHPKFVVAVMVQGASGHGGEVAGPIADSILERS